MATIRISCIAVATLDGMFEDNYRRALRLGDIALRSRPDIVLFPEAFAAGYCSTDLTAFAEDPEQSPWQHAFRGLSHRGNCLVAFGYLERARPRSPGIAPARAPGSALAPGMTAAPVPGVRNAVRLFDRGEPVGTHYKYSLWPDKNIAYRDEPSMMIPGAGIDIFPTRLGKIAILTCYENWLSENWTAAATGRGGEPNVQSPKSKVTGGVANGASRGGDGGADLILSPYNAPGDTTDRQVKGVAQVARPCAWANRTGTVHWPSDGKPNGVMPNPGTAGIMTAAGVILAKSEPGVEAIVTADLNVG